MIAALLLTAWTYTADGASLPDVQDSAAPAAAQTPSAPAATPPPPPPVAPSPAPERWYSIVAGASFSNTQSTTSTTPYADVVMDLPISLGDATAATAKKAKALFRVQAEVNYAGSPGQQAVNLADVSSFNAINAQGSVHVVIGDQNGTRTTAFVQAGWSSRLASGPIQPATANPAHIDFGLAISRKDHTLSLAVSPVSFTTETGDPATAARVDGRATINNAIRLQVSVIYPYLNGPSNAYQVGAVHNVLTVVAVGADLDHILNPPVAVAPTPPGTGQSYAPWHHDPPTS